MSDLVEKVGKRFRTFGGGQLGFNNPMAVALKDEPYQFAACVDVAEVVAFILSESGYDWAIKRAQDLAEKNVALFAALEKYGNHLRSCPATLRTASFKDMICNCGYEAAIAREILNQSTPAPAEPQSQPSQQD